MHETEVFAALRYQILNHHKDLIITSVETFEKVLNLFFHECTKCKTFHDKDILVEIFFILSNELKVEMTKEIIQKLRYKFSNDSYYAFAIYDIIDYKLFFDEYIDLINFTKSSDEIRRWEGQGEA